MNRSFETIDALADFLEEKAIQQIEAMNEAAETGSEMLFEGAFSLYGNDPPLATLAPYTQAERVRLGYTPNNPLLRTGGLLRSKVRRAHTPAVQEGNKHVATAAVGSPEKINLFHEMGSVNVRFHTRNPPRPVFLMTARLTGPRVAEMFSLLTKRVWSS